MRRGLAVVSKGVSRGVTRLEARVVFLTLTLTAPGVGTLAFAANASADEPNAANVAAARQLGVEGVKLANAGNCKDAIDRLSRAGKLYPAPTVLGRLGECQVAVGKLVEGTETLQRVVRDPLPRNPPPAFVKARARAQKVLDANKGRIAHLHIATNAPPRVEISLTIDGEPVSSALVGADRPTDPGDHLVEASAPGYLKTSQSVTLQEGGDGAVTLDLKPDPAAKPEALHPPEKGESPPPPPPLPPPAPPGPSRTPALIAFVAGGAGLVVGGVFGGLALSKRNTLDQSCNASKICPSSDQSDLDSTKTMATVSTIGFIVGGVGVAAGIVLLFVPRAPKVDMKASREPYITPYLTPSSAGVVGLF